MSNHNFTTIIGNCSEVCVNFDYEPADDECGLESEMYINTIGFMHLNSIDCIMGDLSFNCVERIRAECLNYFEG